MQTFREDSGPPQFGHSLAMLADLRFVAFTAMFLVMGSSLGCAGCERARTPADTGPPITVAVEPFAATAVEGGLVLPARIKAAEEATLTARTAGRLTALTAREGARVRRGDAVARFDAPEMRESLTAARSEREAATLAAAIAARQYARVESLFVARVVSPSDREVAESADRNAAARLAGARARTEQLEAAVTLRAPFDGMVVRRHVDAGADVAFGSPVLDLRSSGALEVVVSVPESAVPSLRRGEIEVEATTGEWRTARVQLLDGMIDFVSRTRTARLALGDPSGFEAGGYTRVRIAGRGASTDSDRKGIASSSIVRRGALTGVYVAEAGRARLRWIRLGVALGERVEVLGGLEVGDLVIVAPESLHDGGAVSVGS